MDADEEYWQKAKRQRKMKSRWWQPSVEDYYSPFDPHFDPHSDSEDSDEEEDEAEIIATRGDFAELSTELLVRISGFLDLESLCRGMPTLLFVFSLLHDRICHLLTCPNIKFVVFLSLFVIQVAEKDI